MHFEEIRAIIAKHGRLPVDIATLSEETDLYGAGLTSLTTVHVMLAIEDKFNVEFPETMLGRKTFSSIKSLDEAVRTLKH